MFRTVSLLLVLCGCVLISGCGSTVSKPAVKTVAIAGQMLDVSGKPVPGGMLSLRSTSKADQVASAKIDGEGKFKLTSLIGDERVDGAQPGEYSVLFAPDTIKQTDMPVTLKKTYVISEGQTELEIKLE